MIGGFGIAGVSGELVDCLMVIEQGARELIRHAARAPSCCCGARLMVKKAN